MIRAKLENALIKDTNVIITVLESTALKVQKINEDRLALEKILKLCKKNRDTRVLLKHFNIGSQDGDSSNTEKVNSGEFDLKIKAERESTISQETASNPTALNSFLKEETAVKQELDLMPPPTVRPKRGRKKKDDKASFSSSQSSSPSTRSSVRTTRSNSVRDSEVLCTEPTVVCLTISDDESVKTDEEDIKKSSVKRSKQSESMVKYKAEEMLPPPPLKRSTRTKRNQKNADDTQHETAVNETKSIIRNETFTANTSTKDHKKVNDVKSVEDSEKENDTTDVHNKRQQVRSNKPQILTDKHKTENADTCIDGDTSGKTIYEDATADEFRESSKFKMNAVVIMKNLNTQSNSTMSIETDIDKQNFTHYSQSNATDTTVIIYPKRILSNTTAVSENAQTEDFNNLEDIMTDDETPPATVTKSKTVDPVASSHDKALSKIGRWKGTENQSPVKKLVQVFEKMGKDGNEDRITPSTTRQMKNITPTHQTKLPTANGSSSKVNPYIPMSGTKTVGAGRIRPGSTTATASAIKRSHQEYQERELLRRQKEEEAKKKRERLIQTQTEERKKRAEAQELKMFQVQQKKEQLEQQKLQYLDEQQRLKDEKARQVLLEKQERLGKHKEELEKKQLRYKKGAHNDNTRTKPIYMTQNMPLLKTTDCYDSDEENANVKTARVKPMWTLNEQLHPQLRIMSFFDDECVRNGFFATTPCTPNLSDIFQDIDPVKLNRTSSAVWRKPPRATLIHLPSFSEEAETAN